MSAHLFFLTQGAPKHTVIPSLSRDQTHFSSRLGVNHAWHLHLFVRAARGWSFDRLRMTEGGY
jgi:hypothetical protein